LAVKAGTLVIADTCGFHCRGAVTEAQDRLELFAYDRGSPFALTSGFGHGLWRPLESWGYQRFMAWRAKRKGERSPWRLTTDPICA